MFGACATTTRGTHENVFIESSPPGATAMTKISLQDPISLGDGTESFYLGCAPTPCSINIPRKKSPIITVSKSGYDPISFLVLSTWETGPSSVAEGSIVAGVPDGSHVIAGKADLSKRIPIAGGMWSTGLVTYGVGPVVDLATGANRSLSPNPVTVILKSK